MGKETIVPTGASYNALTFGSKIVGKIEADSDFRIDGIVEGEINCKGKVIVGQKGYLKGSITCANAEVIGTVDGNFMVSETLTLRSTANISGEVKTKILVVEPKAIFNGSCSMTNNNTVNNNFSEEKKLVSK